MCDFYQEPRVHLISSAASAPSLQTDDGRFITESSEIVEYVDSLGGAPLGGSSVDRALVKDWVKTIDAWVSSQAELMVT